MNSLSVVEISSLLMSRCMMSENQLNIQTPPHRDWDSLSRAILVILWGLLIYPLLDPDLKQKKREISVDSFARLFKEYLGDKEECMKKIMLLNEYDYIRLEEQNLIKPGTRLFTAMDAAKMYSVFRGSILSRKIYKSGKK